MTRSTRTVPTFRDRATGAFLGLALGDRFGAPLEFLRGDAVQTTAVDVATCTWTDDTHMSMYLAEAVLEVGKRFDSDVFGHAVGGQFVRWLNDPLMPSTAPGNTCLAGARSFRTSGDWTTSGVSHSDGCGAVMRIVALSIRWSGVELTEAARVSAVITHGHPNAAAVAQAATWLLRDVLEDGRLSGDMVLRVARRSRQAGHPPVVSQALEAAVALAETHDRDLPLPEAAIPDGDGGWRSPSCLGLAVLANLLRGSFEDIIERAARIDGDSDSVAAVAGMFAGACTPRDLPQRWLVGLAERQRIESLANRLCGPRGDGPDLWRSADDPLRVIAIDDDVGVTLAPGKKGWSGFSQVTHDRDVGIDLGALRQAYMGVLVCLLEDHELVSRRMETLPERAVEKGIVFRRFPVPDLGVPTLGQAREIVRMARTLTIVVHCMGGVGRAGTVAACVLVDKGMTADDAIADVRRKRPGAIQTQRQEAFIRAFTMDPDPPFRRALRYRRPSYAGAVVFDGDRVLLRRLDAHGYVWTWPRRQMSADGWDEALLEALGLAGQSVKRD
jgi:ADP-ribosylglycohydrolase/protein-tyrosine phosphatase